MPFSQQWVVRRTMEMGLGVDEYFTSPVDANPVRFVGQVDSWCEGDGEGRYVTGH